MAIDISVPEAPSFTPRIAVVGLGGGGCNAVDNMIEAGLEGVDFVVCNTDAQALQRSRCERKVQLGRQLTRGLGAGTDPEVGRVAAEEAIDEVMDAVGDANMLFVVAGMGGGTGTGAAPVIAKAARNAGILTVAVVTRPFVFEAEVRAETADSGLAELRRVVDSYIVISNQNLFKVTDEATSVVDSFRLADNVLCAGVRGVTDLIMKPGVVNVDFADVRATLKDTGPALMGTGEAEGENRVQAATSAAIHNPLLDEIPTDQAQGLLVNITAAVPTLAEVERIIDMIRERTHRRVNLIFGTAIDESMGDRLRVSVMMTGLDSEGVPAAAGSERRSFDAPKPSASLPDESGVDAGFPFFGSPPADDGASRPADEPAAPAAADEERGNGHLSAGFCGGDPVKAEAAAPWPSRDDAGETDADSASGDSGEAPSATAAGGEGLVEAVPAPERDPFLPPAMFPDGPDAVGEPGVWGEWPGEAVVPAEEPVETGEPVIPSLSSPEPAEEPVEAGEPAIPSLSSPAVEEEPVETGESAIPSLSSPAAGEEPAGIGEPVIPSLSSPAAGEEPAGTGEPVLPSLTSPAVEEEPVETGEPAEPEPAAVDADDDDRKPGFFGRLLELGKDSEPGPDERKEPTLAPLEKPACEANASSPFFGAAEPEPEPAAEEPAPPSPEAAGMAAGEARLTASGEPDVFQIPSFLRRR